MRVEIVTWRDGAEDLAQFDYEKRAPDERPMVLDVLLQAQATTLPDLAFRYGCRARNCGVCTVEVNGKPRIACRARIKEGDRVGPPKTLPVLADLVVKRDGVARQLRDKLPKAAPGNDLNKEAPPAFHALTACIECYACLEGCPMHERNGGVEGAEGFRWGNPFSLLKLERARQDPLTTAAGAAEAVEGAKALGLDACLDCAGCKCGTGIDLKRLVVAPLLEAAGMRPEG